MRYLLLFIFAITALPGCSPFEKKAVVENGSIDLSRSDLKNIIASLDGDWELYWNHLYTPTDFKTRTPRAMTGYIAVPTSWNGQTVGGQKLTGEGFATYRFHVRGLGSGLHGLKVPDAYSAYRLWVNGVLIATNGVVATTAKDEVPELRPLIAVFRSDTVNEFVLQVSNFFQYKGGANSTMSIGSPEQIMLAQDISTISTMFIVGMLLIMAIYHIVIFILSRNDQAAFWFSLLCFFISMRCMVTNEKLIHVVFSNFSPDIASRIEYASVFVGGIFFGLFIRSMFPKEFPKTVMYFVMAFGCIELISLTVLPTKLYTSWLTYYQIGVTQLVYYMAVLVLAAIRRRPSAFSMMVVVLVTILVSANDILYARQILNTGFLVSYAVPFLLLTQSYFIASRIGHALNAVQKLSVELKDANTHLEQKVVERTYELEQEKKKTDDLLRNILPAETAEELKEKGQSRARTYSMVSVMFVDVAGFLHIDENTGAAFAVGEIDHCFRAFDKIVEGHGIEKIKTIGNVYLCAAGLPVPTLNHAEHIINAAREIKAYMHTRQTSKEQNSDFSFDTRIGLNIGPVVAGIVGTKKFAYDIWGDTVNTAARMQQHSEPGRINMSGRMYEHVKNKFECEYRGKIDAKNKGMIDMYYVE